MNWANFNGEKILVKKFKQNEQKKFFMKMCKKAHYFSGGMNCTTNNNKNGRKYLPNFNL